MAGKSSPPLVYRERVPPWVQVRGCPFHFLVSATSVLSSSSFLFGWRQAARGNFLLAKSLSPQGGRSPYIFTQPSPTSFSFGPSHGWFSALLSSWLFILLSLPDLVSLRLLVFDGYERPMWIFHIGTENHQILGVALKFLFSHWLGKYWLYLFYVPHLSPSWSHLPIWLVRLCFVVSVYCF